MVGLWILFLFVTTYACPEENRWQASEPNWIQILSCDSGFQYRVCNSENQWDDSVDNNCQCANFKNCQQVVYNYKILSHAIVSPQVVSTLPVDMDMSTPPTSSITIHFSTSMHRGLGEGSLRSDDNSVLFDSSMITQCFENTCIIQLSSALRPNTFYSLELSPSFFVNEYNLPLDRSIHIVFKTGSRSCGVKMIQDGLGSSHMCSCFSEHDGCSCECGDVQVNRGF